MGGDRTCKCKPRSVMVLSRCCNYSAFSGYHRTSSDYSGVQCLWCGHVWRTKAKWVGTMPEAPDHCERSSDPAEWRRMLSLDVEQTVDQNGKPLVEAGPPKARSALGLKQWKYRRVTLRERGQAPGGIDWGTPRLVIIAHGKNELWWRAGFKTWGGVGQGQSYIPASFTLYDYADTGDHLLGTDVGGYRDGGRFEKQLEENAEQIAEFLGIPVNVVLQAQKDSTLIPTRS